MAIHTLMSEIDKTIENLKKLGESLVRYNYPYGGSADESAINPLKAADISIDGFEVTVHYSKSDYNDHYLETFQVLGKEVPFLPFGVVCKLATKALGGDSLSLVEFYKDQRKIYCWTLVTDKEGGTLEYPFEEDQVEYLEYEGWEYTYMNPSQVRFY